MTQINDTTTAPSIHAITHAHSGTTEHFLTILAEPGSPPVDAFDQMNAYLASLDSPAILRMDILGEVNTEHSDKHQQRYCYNCNDCSLNHNKQDALGECPIAGIYVHAITGGSITPIWLGGHLVGNEFSNQYVRYLLIDNLLPEANLNKTAQTRQLFERMEDALRSKNMTFDNVARTWLYLDRILDWYDEFNIARNDFFEERHTFRKLVPASTGVGGSNNAGAAIQAGVLAAEALTEGVTIQPVASPLQCPALDYGSSFSRAVEIATPEIQRLYISGTASIDQDGPTLHVGDVDAQIACTMEIVHAILTSRGMDWKDIVRGVAYLKNKQDFARFTAYCSANGIPDMPVGLVQNDVCRDDLLFEIEADAIKGLK